jgi:hypothetical protein
VASDNMDGTRQDPQANLHNPVLESHVEEQNRVSACEQRIKYGDIFLLLHLLEPWVKVDDAIRELQDLYLYAGFDCTNKWANFLGDTTRRKTMATRLKETLGVAEEEIQFCQKNSLQHSGVLPTLRRRLRTALSARTQEHLAA